MKAFTSVSRGWCAQRVGGANDVGPLLVLSDRRMYSSFTLSYNWRTRRSKEKETKCSEGGDKLCTDIILSTLFSFDTNFGEGVQKHTLEKTIFFKSSKLQL